MYYRVERRSRSWTVLEGTRHYATLSNPGGADAISLTLPDPTGTYVKLYIKHPHTSKVHEHLEYLLFTHSFPRFGLFPEP